MLDVHIAFMLNIQALVDKIAFEYQLAVLMVPDLFQGRPWMTNGMAENDGVKRNEEGQLYKERGHTPGMEDGRG